MQSLYFPHTLLQPLFVCQCCELSFTIHTLVPCDSLMKVPFLLPVLLCSQHVFGVAHTTSEVLSTTSQPSPLISASQSYTSPSHALALLPHTPPNFSTSIFSLGNPGKTWFSHRQELVQWSLPSDVVDLQQQQTFALSFSLKAYPNLLLLRIMSVNM